MKRKNTHRGASRCPGCVCVVRFALFFALFCQHIVSVFALFFALFYDILGVVVRVVFSPVWAFLAPLGVSGGVLWLLLFRCPLVVWSLLLARCRCPLARWPVVWVRRVVLPLAWRCASLSLPGRQLQPLPRPGWFSACALLCSVQVPASFPAVPGRSLCPLWCSRGCLVCSGQCSVVRCPSCPPPAGGVGLVRLAVQSFSCVCPGCGAWALVLSASGAGRPFCWCASCGGCLPAPARSRWSPGLPAAQAVGVQLSLALAGLF